MYTVKSIIPFDLLVDTDVGVIKYIQFHFQNDDRFYKGILESVEPDKLNFIKNLLVERRFANPVSIIMKQEKLIVSDPDGMLNSFLSDSKIYKEILEYSCATSIFDMVCRSFFVSDSLKYTILCKSDMEVKFLKKKFEKRFKTDKVPGNIITGTPESVDIKRYDAIYVKDIHDLDKYYGKRKLPEGKNFIIAYYKFNMEYVPEDDKYINIPLMEVSSKYSGVNEMSFINVYPVYVDSNEVG